MTWINQKEPFSYAVPHSSTCLQLHLPFINSKGMVLGGCSGGLYSTLTMYLSQDI